MKDHIGGWSADDTTAGVINRPPHEELAETEEGRAVLRSARLAVTAHVADVDEARLVLAMCGLIPDPDPDAVVRRDPINNNGPMKKKEPKR